MPPLSTELVSPVHFEKNDEQHLQEISRLKEQIISSVNRALPHVYSRFFDRRLYSERASYHVIGDELGWMHEAWLERWSGKSEEDVELHIQPVMIGKKGKPVRELGRCYVTITGEDVTYGPSGGTSWNMLESFGYEQRARVLGDILETVNLIEAASCPEDTSEISEEMAA